MIAGLDIATGTFALMVFSVCAALVVVAVMARIMLRRAGKSGMANALVVFGLGLVGGLSVYALFDRSMLREQATERRAIEARAAELTARSLAPGSALGCLDAVASVVVENACERPLFASPEAVATNVRRSMIIRSPPWPNHSVARPSLGSRRRSASRECGVLGLRMWPVVTSAAARRW